MNRLIITLAMMSGLIAGVSFAENIECTGKLKSGSSVTINVARAADEPSEATASGVLMPKRVGRRISEPRMFRFDISQVDDSDGQSDVSILYQGKTGLYAKTQMRISDNKATGASYVKNLPGASQKKIDLSCK